MPMAILIIKFNLFSFTNSINSFPPETTFYLSIYNRLAHIIQFFSNNVSHCSGLSERGNLIYRFRHCDRPQGARQSQPYMSFPQSLYSSHNSVCSSLNSLCRSHDSLCHSHESGNLSFSIFTINPWSVVISYIYSTSSFNYPSFLI